ncbi:MAG: FMN-binding protein [Candidatus Firestonebacteria bacterium]
MSKILFIAFCLLCFCDAPLFSIELKDIENNYKKIFPAAAAVREATANGKTYYSVLDESGKQTGIILYTERKGYEGLIKLITGFDPDAKIATYLMSHRETPHYVTEIVKPDFKKRFSGKGREQLKLKQEDPKGEIDGVTGATVTLKALVGGLSEAAELAEEILKPKSKKDADK